MRSKKESLHLLLLLYNNFFSFFLSLFWAANHVEKSKQITTPYCCTTTLLSLRMSINQNINNQHYGQRTNEQPFQTVNNFSAHPLRNNWLPPDRKIMAVSTSDLIKANKQKRRRNKKSSVNEYSGLAGNYAAFSTLSYLGTNEDLRREMREIPGQISYSRELPDEEASKMRMMMMRRRRNERSEQQQPPPNWILLPATWQDPSTQGSNDGNGKTWTRRSKQHYFNSHHYQQ